MLGHTRQTWSLKTWFGGYWCLPRGLPLALFGQGKPGMIKSAVRTEGSSTMSNRGTKNVGRISIEIEVANYGDMVKAREGLLGADQVRRHRIRGVVDSGAAKLVLPQAVAKSLGLHLMEPITVRYADGRKARRREAEGAYVELLGRHGTFTAIVEPKRETAQIGAIVLEDLDLLVDCQKAARGSPRSARRDLRDRIE
jgi:predicted aspartyl protease